VKVFHYNTFFTFLVHSYGAKGYAVILSTIYRLFDPTSTTTEAIAPLRFTSYATYVLVPYVAHLLISEDLGCPPEDAYKTMLDSQQVGAMLHPELDDDSELEDIFEANNRAARIEKEQVSQHLLHVFYLLHTLR
jgi:hypothetical protein